MLSIPQKIGPASVLTLLVTGIWMMVDTWGGQPWIHTALASVVAIAVTAGAITGRAMRRVRMGVEGGGGLDASDVQGALGALIVSLRFRIAIAIGIVGLMTFKPGLAGSLFIMGAALIMGLVASLFTIVSRPANEDSRGNWGTNGCGSIPCPRCGMRGTSTGALASATYRLIDTIRCRAQPFWNWNSTYYQRRRTR